MAATLLVQPSLFIRADGDQHIGLGHLMRCFSIAETALTQDIQCFWLARSIPEALKQQWQALGIIFLDWQVAKEDVHQSIEYLNTLSISVALIDGYYFGLSYQQALQLHCRLVLFNDFPQPNLSADIIINSALSANINDYQPTTATLLLGPQYVSLRSQFRDYFPLSSLGDVLVINFGGADPNNYTQQLCQQLIAHRWSYPTIVITGPSYLFSEAINDLCIQAGWQHFHHPKHFIELLTQARLVVAAPGGLLHELAYLTLPSLFLIAAENQQANAQAHSQIGWCEAFMPKQIEQLSQRIIDLWSQKESLQIMKSHAHHLVDLAGNKRILDTCFLHIQQNK